MKKPKPITNHAASARARLLDLARRTKTDFQRVLQRYAVERLLYRLGCSQHRDRFVVKGATLFVLWDDRVYRPTRDLDLAGYWSNDAESLLQAFHEILTAPCPEDGIVYDLATLSLEPIRDLEKYHGFRLQLKAALDGAKIPMQVDVGFGDAVVPAPALAEFPALLSCPAPQVRVYARETAISEKLHAMVSHGLANSRMKDFFDVYVLSRRFEFEGALIVKSIAATFSRRGRSPGAEPEIPPALGAAFYSTRADFWRGFLRRFRETEVPDDFAAVGEQVRAFLLPAWQALATGTGFDRSWPPGGPWQEPGQIGASLSEVDPDRLTAAFGHL